MTTEPMTPTPTETEPTVLIIEDDPHWQHVMVQSLRLYRPSLKARCVRSTKQAIEALRNHPKISLVISDQYLEGQETGIDFWEYVRAHHPKLPFMLVSSARSRSFANRLRAAGAELPFFTKPFAPEELQLALRMFLRAL